MSTITFVSCWKPQPGQQFQAYEKNSGIVVFAATQAEAVAEFKKVWDFLAPVEWVYGPPPRPVRPEAEVVIDPADRSRAATVYKGLMKRYHSDLTPTATYTVDQLVAAINELWIAMRPQK